MSTIPSGRIGIMLSSGAILSGDIASGVLISSRVFSVVSGWGSYYGAVASGTIAPAYYRRPSLSQACFDFFVEQIHDTAERGFMETLYKNPQDIAARNAYADWLEEHNRLKTSENVKRGWTFGME